MKTIDRLNELLYQCIEQDNGLNEIVPNIRKQCIQIDKDIGVEYQLHTFQQTLIEDRIGFYRELKDVTTTDRYQIPNTLFAQKEHQL